MRVTQISVENYKSLRSVNISPTQLSIVVGANASGKSNLADCLDFISEIYRHGLEVAVGRKGGYENIAFRKMRRSKKPVKISLCVEYSSADSPFRRRSQHQRVNDVRVEHSFAFVARGYSIRAEYEVVQENLVISKRDDKEWAALANIVRSKDGYSIHRYDGNQHEVRTPISKRSAEELFFDFSDLEYFTERSKLLPPTELIVNSIGKYAPSLYTFLREVGGIRAFQISPTKSREFGVPTPTPELDRSGGNLPAVIDMMQKKHPTEWKSVMQSMRAILPDLKSIDVDYTSAKTLGLFFNEEAIGRPWSVEEVSDGTIQTLTILVAIFNPESTMLIIEEPENSVHPWIIRHILEACREASKNKQIILTTHSPIVINAVRPEEVWVIWRTKGESRLAPLQQLDPDFFSMWEGGDIPTFEYIDSGALPRAIPPEPSLVLDEEEE